MKPPLDRPRAVLMAVPSGGGPNPNPTQDVLVDRPTATRNGSPCRTSGSDGLLPGRTASRASHGARLCRSVPDATIHPRSEEHTSELQSLMRISYAVFCLKKKKRPHHINK